MEFKSLQAGDMRWRYADQGEGPPVILIHGFPDTPQSWGAIAQSLNDAGYRTLIPYLRGYHTDTLVEGRPYDATTTGDDMVLFASALGLKDVTIVGHDWGATIAYAAAALAPDVFKTVVPIAVPHIRTLRPSGPLQAAGLIWLARHFLYFRTPWGQAGARRNNFAYIETLYDRWAPDWRGEPRDASVARAKELFATPACLEGSLAYYRASNKNIDKRLFGRLAGRGLLVGGAQDFGGHAGPYHKSLELFDGGGEVMMVEGAGHWPHREKEPAFTAKLIAFLQG